MSRASLFRFVVSWAVVLVIGSLLPLHVKKVLHTTANHHVIHPLLHFGAFIALSIMGSSFAKSTSQRFLNLITVACFGVFLEILEVFYYHQKLEIHDIRLDASGALIGYFSVVIFMWMRNREEQIMTEQ